MVVRGIRDGGIAEVAEVVDGSRSFCILILIGKLQSYLPKLFRINQYNASNDSQRTGKFQLVAELGPARPQLVVQITLGFTLIPKISFTPTTTQTF